MNFAKGGTTVKVQQHKMLVPVQASRRTVLKGAAGLSALAATGGISALAPQAAAQSDLRTQLLKIPGVGKGSPTDADWQKVGEMCLGATKANVKEGEFK